MPVEAVRGCPSRVLSGAVLKDERQSVHGGVLEAVGLTLGDAAEQTLPVSNHQSPLDRSRVGPTRQQRRRSGLRVSCPRERC